MLLPERTGLTRIDLDAFPDDGLRRELRTTLTSPRLPGLALDIDQLLGPPPRDQD